MRTSTRLAVGAGVLLMLTLSACSSAKVEPSPAPTTDVIKGSEQTPSQSPSESASPAATPTPYALTAPECETLISLEWLTSKIDSRIEGPTEHTDRGPGNLPGPVAQAALAESETLRACAWGIPQTDGGFGVTVLAIGPAVQRGLEDAMAASSLYTHRVEYTDPIYSRLLNSGIGWGYAQGFAGGYWIIASGSMIDPDTSSELVAMALDGVTGRAD